MSINGLLAVIVAFGRHIKGFIYKFSVALAAK